MLAALDRIASDPGNRDYLSDPADEQQVERLIDQAKSLLRSNGMGGAGRSLQGDCAVKRVQGAELLATQIAVEKLATGNLATALTNLVNDDLRRSGRDIERLRGAVRLLSMRGSPKGMVYFADTLRTNPGRFIASAVNELSNMDRNGAYPHPVSARPATRRERRFYEEGQ